MTAARPMKEMLDTLAPRVSLHMPGHKGKPLFGEGNSFQADTTELPVTDDLYAPSGAIAKAQSLMADAAGAGHSLMLTGGATAGIHAMMMYALRPGETVILPRNAHLSVINACILGDIHPVFVPCSITLDGYAHVPAESFLQAIQESPQARAVLVTRLDYYGGMVPLERIARAAHDAGMRLLVDEAHGAHLPWMEGIKSAGACGADLWVQSAHKTLPALTGAAWLHLKQEEDENRARRMLRMVQTSSPGFSILKSLDDARAWMEDNGRQALFDLQQLLQEIRLQMQSWGYRDAHEIWRNLPLSFDPTRLVIDAPQGGYALAQSLQKQGIDVEMADERRVVCIFTVMDGPETAERLLSALFSSACQPKLQPDNKPTAFPLPRRLMPLRQAALSDLQTVSFKEAVGRTAGASAGLYPPGIPLVTPGEEITPEVVSLIASAPPESRFGLSAGQFLCVQ